MQLTDKGDLVIHATMASGALPVPGTIVRIRGAEEENRFIVYSVITDEDGNTGRISLPAPAKEYSLSPNEAEKAYSIYDIELTAEGYYPKRIYSVAVFPGITATQPINMIPLSQNGTFSDYPRGNLNAVVRENDLL